MNYKKYKNDQGQKVREGMRPGRMPSDDRHGSNPKFKQPKPLIQTTTLWDFPSQHYGNEEQGDGEYAGVTPSYVVWNLLQRYTKPGSTVLDPMCGSGTTLDVSKDLGRIGLGYDLAPTRASIHKADARKLPLNDKSVDFAFIDPPYSTHIKYSGDPKCIGELDARGGGYYEAMEQVLAELYRVLKPGGYLALYIQDSFTKDKPFAPLGFELFLRLSVLFEPVDVICVTRHNKKLKRNHWHTSAIEGNYYLRGFNYLFVVRKQTADQNQLLNHAGSGALSFYFRQVAQNDPAKVVTPEHLAKAIESDREIMDKRLVRKEGKKAFKQAKRQGQNQTGTRDQRTPNKNENKSARKGQR